MKGDKGRLLYTHTLSTSLSWLLHCSPYIMTIINTKLTSSLHISEFSGTLLGFDDYVNMVLEDVTEFDYSGTHTKLPKILLNGNNVCMVS